MRKKSAANQGGESKRSRVYQYGLLPPVVGADFVIEQMRRARRYANTLVEIEIGRRNAFRAAEAGSPAVAAAAQRLETARIARDLVIEALKTSRSKARSRVTSDDQKVAIISARAEYKSALKAFNEARKASRDELKAEKSRINGLSSALVRGARDLIGKDAPESDKVFWGTYQLVEAAADQASGAPLYDEGEPNNPRFRRWDGNGRVGVQIQKGMPVAGVWGSHSFLRVDPEATWCKKNRHGDERRKLPLLHIRVGSNGRDPIWASWPILMHRPLPEGGVIKRCDVTRRVRGPRVEWTVEFTLETRDCAPREFAKSGTVAVHLGWAAEPEGIRVATWMSTAGETGAIVVDNDTLSRLNESARIRSIRDKNFDAARDALSAWLSVTPEVPDWLRKKTATIGQWKSPKRLAALAIEWRGRRFDDDASGYEPVEAWRYNDHHLWAWETTAKPIRRRRELYRLAAAALGKRFGSLVMDDTNLSALARRPSVESDGDAKQAHRNRVLAAPYALKEALRNVYGKSLVVVPAEGLSHTCPDCGSSDAAQRDKAKRWVACVRCTFSRDEDTTALMNTLARAGFAREVADMIKRGHEFAAALKGGQ